MENDTIELVSSKALLKKELLMNNPMQFLVRAALAGIYISFAVILCFKLGDAFYQANSQATQLASGIFFGIALALIIFGGAELFTGNTMYFTIATMRRVTSIKDLLKNWGATYTGNLLGVILFAGLFSMSGIFASIGPDHFLIDVVETKMALSTTELFFRGILCNWLVCLALWIPMRAKGDGAKLALTMLIVFAFFLSGYEHSIANMSLFTIALFGPHPDTVTLAGFIHNLVPVTLGNIVGGGFFVGAVYAYLQTNKKAKVSVVKQDFVQHAPQSHSLKG